jgi:lipoprotein-releasing system permease protein
MSVLLILDIARTLLMARVKQSVVAAVGVTFGIGMFISLMGYMQGLNKLLDDLILNRTPHVLIYNETLANEKQPVKISKEHTGEFHFIRSVRPKDSAMEVRNSLAVMSSLKRDAQVAGIAPKITSQVFYNAGTIDLNGIVYGIDVSQEEKLFAFSEYIVQGKAKNLESISNSIILGKGIAEKLRVETGDMIEVSTARGRRLSLRIVGIFQLGVADIDVVQSYTSLETLQHLLGKNSSYITDIQVKLHDMNLAPQVAKRYRLLYEADTKDVLTSNTQFETGSSIRNMITYAVSITLLIVAGFGIYNILNMMIYEKMDSIAIMKATGFSGKDVRRIFLSLSLIIGISGGLAGLVFGFIGSYLIDQIPFETASLPALKTMPMIYMPRYYITGILFAILTTWLAGFLPARRASKVDPVEIIRGK